MDNKGINGKGLAHLWDRANTEFATKKEVQDALAGGGGQGGAVQEVFWVNCDFDPSTMSISNFSVTFREIETALSNGKFVKSKVALLGLNQNAYGDLFASSENELDFSLFSVNNFGTGNQLYHFNLALFADDTTNMTIRLVDTTKM